MTPERFAQLAEAYGGHLHRWPRAEQAEAQALLDAGDASLLEVLHQARWLDGQLDGYQLAQIGRAHV